MSNEYIKPRNKVIKWYYKLSYTWQLIAEANYMSRRVEVKEKWSKKKYKEISENIAIYRNIHWTEYTLDRYAFLNSNK